MSPNNRNAPELEGMLVSSQIRLSPVIANVSPHDAHKFAHHGRDRPCTSRWKRACFPVCVEVVSRLNRN